MERSERTHEAGADHPGGTEEREDTMAADAREGAHDRSTEETDDLSVAHEESTAAEQVVVGDLETLRRERDELLDTSRRLQADFENFRKRMLREQTVMVERASEGLIEKLMPVLDSFELALGQIETGDVPEKVHKGIELVFGELLGALEGAGLERVGERGEVFDPHVHEAVVHEEGDEEPRVSDVMRRGYRLKGKVLRPAMVKVSAAGDVGDAGGPGGAVAAEERSDE